MPISHCAPKLHAPSSPRLPLLAALLALLVLISCPWAASARSAPDPVGTWPLSPQPRVVRGFDPPDAPWGAGHRGVDLAGQPGQAVLAALPGRVRFAGVIAGRGTVVIDHGDTRTTYEPVLAIGKVGDVVGLGERIGVLTLAKSHCAPAACLHLGWIRNLDDVYLDPLRLVGGGPIRLLPLWRDSPVPIMDGRRPWTFEPAVPRRTPPKAFRVLEIIGSAAPVMIWRTRKVTSAGQARGWACW